MHPRESHCCFKFVRQNLENLLEARETNIAENQRASDLIQTVLNDEKFREEAHIELRLQEDASLACVAFKFVDENEQNPILQALRQLHQIRVTVKAVLGTRERLFSEIKSCASCCGVGSGCARNNPT